ncbi:hypothetical protein [Paenibacillus roseus]|uniref:Uncharacterized protein n=1 Tax=Paenibacillus roseus TaxID=2798579 RepID=A0A934J4X2_9BACL|nr:hypothetical protein [Paenibacillus roseus]MBJ6360412.1 hypothetical protein [Paenibacillus roseus]
MTIHYRIPCFDCELLVKQTEASEASFQVGIQNRSNPLGFGNLIGSYATKTEAIQHANHFCQFYTMAKEKGYHFKENAFIKKDKETIPVAMIMKATPTAVDLERFFK